MSTTKTMGTSLAHAIARRGTREISEGISNRVDAQLRSSKAPRKRAPRLKWFLETAKRLAGPGHLYDEIEGEGKNAAAFSFLWLVSGEEIVFYLYHIFARTGQWGNHTLVVVRPHAIARIMQTYKVNDVESAMAHAAPALMACWTTLYDCQLFDKDDDSVNLKVENLGEIRGEIKDRILFVKTIIGIDSMNPSKAERFRNFD